MTSFLWEFVRSSILFRKMTDIKMCKLGMAVYAYLALKSGSPIFDMTKVCVPLLHVVTCCVKFTMNGSWPLPSSWIVSWFLVVLKRHVGHVCPFWLFWAHKSAPVSHPGPEVSDFHSFAMFPLLRAPRSLRSSTACHATACEQIAAVLVAEDLLQRSRRRDCRKDWERWMKIKL